MSRAIACGLMFNDMTIPDKLAKHIVNAFFISIIIIILGITTLIFIFTTGKEVDVESPQGPRIEIK